MTSSKKIAKNKIKQPSETAFTTAENSSNLERTNQCWYNPANENIIAQYTYTTTSGIKKEVVCEYGIHPDSILIV